jgi:hypothetical protein
MTVALFSFVDENLPMVPLNETSLFQTSIKRYRDFSDLRMECLEFMVEGWNRNVAPLGGEECRISVFVCVITGHMCLIFVHYSVT